MSSKEAVRGAYFTAPEGTRCAWAIPGVRTNMTYAIDRKVSWSGKNDPAGEEQYRRRYHGGLPMAAGERRADGCDTESYSAWQFHLLDHGAWRAGLTDDRLSEDAVLASGWPHPQDVYDYAASKFPSLGIPFPAGPSDGPGWPKPPAPPSPPVNPPPPLQPTPVPVVPPTGKTLSPVPQRLEELRVIVRELTGGPLIAPSACVWLGVIARDDRYWPWMKQLLGPLLEMWRAIKARAERP